MTTIVGVGGRTDGRCGDPLLWDEFPAHRREAELRKRRGPVSDPAP